LASACEESQAPAKEKETIYQGLSPVRRWRRRLFSYLYRFPDTGWFGLKPLRTHIAICGFRRSGTTLLQMMMEYALPNARRFGREMSAWRAATYQWRNHEVLISKAPDDIFRLDRLLRFYEEQAARLCPIVLIRDPRDVLTSRLAGAEPGRYYLDLAMWRQYRRILQSVLHAPGALFLRYEDLVTDTTAVQRRIDAFTREPSQRSFLDFYNEPRTDFDTLPLNGVRPVDNHSVDRWRRPEHRPRIAALLDADPGFADTLVDLGYETSSDWVQEWRDYEARPIAAGAAKSWMIGNRLAA
jgi:hypothetical protein